MARAARDGTRRPERRNQPLAATPEPTPPLVEPREWRLDLATAAAVAVAGLTVFFLTAAPGIVTEGDAAEFTATAAVGGIAHPPGYPSYILIGWVLSWLVPAMHLARTLNLLSVVCGAAAASFLTALSLLLLRRFEPAPEQAWLRRAAALTTGLLFIASREIWTQSISAEVYAVMMALLMGSLLVSFGDLGRRRPWLLPLLLGFGYGIHHTLIVLSVPIIAEYLWRTEGWRSWRTLAAVAGGWALGVSTFVYLPLRSMADPAMDFVDPETWSGFRKLVTMEGMPSVNPEIRDLAAWNGQISSYLHQFWRQLPFWAYFLFPVGLFATIRRKPWTFVWLLLAIFFATNFGFIFITNFQPGSSFENEVRVFYLPSYAMVALWAGLALWFGLRAAWPRLTTARARTVVTAAVTGLVVVGWGVWLASVWHGQDKSRDRIADNYGRDLLTTPRAPAMIFTPGDNAAQPILYLQRVEGFRTDVAAVHLPLIPLPWYHKMLQRMYPDLRVPASNPSILTFIEANYDRRKIYFVRTMQASQIPGYRLEPEGILLRVVREDEPRTLPPEPVPTYAHILPYEAISKDLRERSILTEYREGMLRLGSFYLELDRADRALEALRIANGFPAVDFIGDVQMRAYGRLQLATALSRVGDNDQAQRVLEDLVNERPDFGPGKQALDRLRRWRQTQPPSGG